MKRTPVTADGDRTGSGCDLLSFPLMIAMSAPVALKEDQG